MRVLCPYSSIVAHGSCLASTLLAIEEGPAKRISFSKLKEDVTCDIVVLGGGISGAFVDRAFVGGEDDSFRNPARRDRLVTPRTDQLAKRFGEMFPAIELEVAYR